MTSLSTLFILFGLWATANLLAVAALNLAYHLWSRTVEWTHDGFMPSAIPLSKGDGETAILFVHGFNDVPFVWSRFVDELARRNYHCHAVRVPGAGEQNCHPSLEAMREAIDTELKHLKSTHRHVILTGHSMGGALALDAVLRGTDIRPDGIFLLAPLIEVSRKRSPILSAHAYFRLARIFFPLLRWIPSVFKEYLHAEDDPSFVYRRDRFNEINWYIALFQLVKILRRADKSRLKLPLLVFTAGNDRVVDSSATIRWFKDVPSATVHECNGKAHVLPLLTGWHDLLEELDRFARKVGSK